MERTYRPLVLSMIIVFGGSSTVWSQLTFDFLRDHDSVVIGTLQLAELSTDPADILSLTFTEEGQTLFGFGPIYEGTFDRLSQPEDGGRFSLDIDEFGRKTFGGTFGVGFEVGAVDSDPPNSTLPGIDFDSDSFGIGASSVIGGAFDWMTLQYLSPETFGGLN